MRDLTIIFNINQNERLIGRQKYKNLLKIEESVQKGNNYHYFLLSASFIFFQIFDFGSSFTG
jgi:hypothetical protein